VDAKIEQELAEEAALPKHKAHEKSHDRRAHGAQAIEITIGSDLRHASF
jgi:hypothetical protein